LLHLLESVTKQNEKGEFLQKFSSTPVLGQDTHAFGVSAQRSSPRDATRPSASGAGHAAL